MQIPSPRLVTNTTGAPAAQQRIGCNRGAATATPILTGAPSLASEERTLLMVTD